MSEEKMSTGTACLVLLLMPALLPAMSIYTAFAFGYVTAKIWLWYLVPVGVTAYGWKVFAAVYWIWNMLRVGCSTTLDGEKDTSSKVAASIGLALIPWLYLLIAWWLL